MENNEYTFLFRYDDQKRRYIIANGLTYTVAKQSLAELLHLIMEKGNASDRKKVEAIDDTIACYVPDEVFVSADDDALARYVDKNFYDGELLAPDDSEIENQVFLELNNITDTDYARHITNRIIKDVIKDVKDTSDYPDYNDSDIRLAIGRVLLNALEKE